MNSVGWNCRGAGDPATVREVKNLVASVAPSILLLVETQVGKRRMENLSSSFGFNNCFAISSEGRSGGLAMYWNGPLVLDLIGFSRDHIDMKVTEQGKEPWRITGIYGEANKSERFRTWDLLKDLKAKSDLPWVCMGDFNEVLRREEHFGVGERDEAQMRGFRDAVDICGLSDLGYTGLDWTFEKKVRGGTYTRVRLDRALADSDWWMRFPFAELRHLTAAKSDHCPIQLVVDSRSQVPKRRSHQRVFRYEMMWETHPDFHTVVEQNWTDQGQSTSVEGLTAKLASFSRSLNKWDREVFGEVRVELKRLQTRLGELRADPTRTGPCHEEIKVCDKIIELNHREEIMWRQRSRVQWLSEGDNNTKFFHRKASSQRRKNKIDALQKPDGSVTEDHGTIKSMTREFYANLFTSEGTYGMDAVLNTVPTRVTNDMNADLIKPYTEEEVKTALFQMVPSKAPGPDGFPAHFFQRHWDLCGSEVTKVVLNVLEGRESLEAFNATSVVLIPKVNKPNLLSQFRPISLCNVLLKIVSKVQANRLKLILPEIISPEQSAFVPGRLITDNIISVYECLHFMKKKRGRHKQFCALKVDMMKAYDRVE